MCNILSVTFITHYAYSTPRRVCMHHISYHHAACIHHHHYMLHVCMHYAYMHRSRSTTTTLFPFVFFFTRGLLACSCSTEAPTQIPATTASRRVQLRWRLWRFLPAAAQTARGVQRERNPLRRRGMGIPHSPSPSAHLATSTDPLRASLRVHHQAAGQ